MKLKRVIEKVYTILKIIINKVKVKLKSINIMKHFICLIIFVILFSISQKSYSQYRNTKITAYVSSGDYCSDYYNPLDSLTMKINKKNKVKLIYYIITSGNSDSYGSVSIDLNGNITEIINPLKKVKYIYDNKGNPIEKTEYNNDGLLKSKNIYKYDNDKKVIEEIENNLKINYEYNNRGKLERGYSNVGSTEYKYDKNDYLIEEIDYSKDGNKSGKRTYSYEKGKLKELCEYSGKETIQSKKTTYNYDNNGNLIEEKILYSQYETLNNDRAYMYNDKNNLIKEIYTCDNYTNTILYIYDSNNKIRANLLIEKNEISCYTGYTYWYYNEK